MDQRQPSSGRTPRLFVESVLHEGAVLTLPGAPSHYLSRVLRLSEGAGVLLFDDATGEWRARIAEIGKRSVVVRIEVLTRPRERVPDLWLCAAPLKRGRVDWLAEKACELGVARLIPTLTRRTVVEKPNLARLRAHMIEAAEQCERTALPELADPVPLARLLATWPAERQLIFCDEEGGAAAIGGMRGVAAPAAILIGPEGGFDAGERAAIRNAQGAVAISLGPRVLRADTAAAVAVALWQAVNGDWAGDRRG